MSHRISVVIPCYRQAHFLGEALASLEGQTRLPDQVVVVDDGSPDDVASVVRSHPGVTLIRQENRGLAAARNRGLEACTGDLALFLDADDRLLPTAVDVAAASLSIHPEWAFVWGFNRGIDARGEPHPRPPTTFEGEATYERLLERNHVGAPAGVLFRAADVRAVGGFDPALPAAEDYDLYLRIARRRAFACHGQLVAEYRHHGANMSGDPDRMLRAMLTVLGREERWLEQADAGRELRRALRRGRRFAWLLYDGEPRLDRLRDALRAGSWREARSHALHLARHYPGLLAQAAAAGVRRRLT